MKRLTDAERQKIKELIELTKQSSIETVMYLTGYAQAMKDMNARMAYGQK